jgi:hypothetical protein
MSRQLGLHHTKTRSQTHAGHPIFTQSARSSTAFNSLSSPDNTDELCQFVTARPPPDADSARTFYARSDIPQTCNQAGRSVAGQSTPQSRAPAVLLGDPAGIAGVGEAPINLG